MGEWHVHCTHGTYRKAGAAHGNRPHIGGRILQAAVTKMRQRTPDGVTPQNLRSCHCCRGLCGPCFSPRASRGKPSRSVPLLWCSRAPPGWHRGERRMDAGAGAFSRCCPRAGRVRSALPGRPTRPARARGRCLAVMNNSEITY